MDVDAFAPEFRARLDLNHDPHVSWRATAGTGLALIGHPQLCPVFHPCWDIDFDGSWLLHGSLSATYLDGKGSNKILMSLLRSRKVATNQATYPARVTNNGANASTFAAGRLVEIISTTYCLLYPEQKKKRDQEQEQKEKRVKREIKEEEEREDKEKQKQKKKHTCKIGRSMMKSVVKKNTESYEMRTMQYISSVSKVVARDVPRLTRCRRDTWRPSQIWHPYPCTRHRLPWR